jgi:hypothetical protein
MGNVVGLEDFPCSRRYASERLSLDEFYEDRDSTENFKMLDGVTSKSGVEPCENQHSNSKRNGQARKVVRRHEFRMHAISTNTQKPEIVGWTNTRDRLEPFPADESYYASDKENACN